MRKLLFLLFVSITCMVKAGNNNPVTYLYQGIDTEFTDSATKHKILLRKNVVIYVDGCVDDTLKTVKLRIGNGQWFDFKPTLKPKEKMSQFFKKMPKVGKLAISSFGSMTELENYKKENPKKNMLVAVVSFTDGKNLLLNNTSADIDVYMNDSFSQTLDKGGCMIVSQPANADSVNVVVACAKKLPTVFTVKFGEATDGGVPAWWVAVAAVFALLVGAGVTIGIIIRFKKKSADKSNKKKAAVVDANDFKLSVNKNPPSQFKGYEQRIGKQKQIICLMQTVKFPTNKDFLNNYIDEIVRYYGGNESIRKYIDDELKRNVDVQLSLDLPVTFSTKKPRNRDAWKKVKPGHNIYWVKFIAPFVEPDSQAVSESTALQSENVLNDAEELVARLSALLPQQQNGESVEVLPEKVKVNVSELYGVHESLKSLVANVNDELANIDKKILNANNAANEQMRMLKKDFENEIKQLNESNAKNVQVAVADNDKKWEEDTKKLKQQHDKTLARAAKLEGDYKREKEAKEKALETINNLNATIVRKDEELREYNTRLVFYRSCSEYADLAVEMFDTVNAVEQLASRLYNAYMENGRDRDAFCYFMTRVNRKFLSSVSQIKNLHEVYEAELRMLAATGLVPKNGWIDHLLESQKKESMWTWQLQAKLYRDVFEQYSGCAVIMVDEYAYMMGKMLADIDKDIEKELVTKSEHLRKLVVKLGYKLVYARPFTPITKYDNVENTDFVDIGIAKDTIVEIKKMGVAYGTKNPKTEVTVQQ